MSVNTVATTILEQLGGRRFQVMTGAKNFIGIGKGLAFRLPSNFATDGANHVTVSLESNDTYTMTFSKVRGASQKIIATKEDVYCDQLQAIFTKVTGLNTRL